jgi:hypothetical protein
MSVDAMLTSCFANVMRLPRRTTCMLDHINLHQEQFRASSLRAISCIKMNDLTKLLEPWKRACSECDTKIFVITAHKGHKVALR